MVRMYRCYKCNKDDWKVHMTTYHKVLRIICSNCGYEEDFN